MHRVLPDLPATFRELRQEVVQANLEKAKAIQAEIDQRKREQAQQQAMFDAQKQAADAQAKAYSDLVEKANKLYGIEVDKNGKAIAAGGFSIQGAKAALDLERERQSVASRTMSASQLVAQTQSSIRGNQGGPSRISQALSGMSNRQREGYQNALARQQAVAGNNRGKFEERRAKEVERTNSLLEQMIADGLKTKSGPATAG